jgi:mannose-6-phosphate isomerase-like protein (cupin superfamily)
MQQDFKASGRGRSATLAAFGRNANLGTSMFYMGSVMSFLAKGEETAGRFALMEYHSRPGNEPPPHIHEWENELYYILEGHVDFYCEDKLLSAGPGHVAFLPQGKAHAFTVRSPSVRMLILVQATGEHPVGLDRYFMEMAEPARSMTPPDSAVTYVMDDPEHAVRVGAVHGIRILSAAETADALPHYPGFGVPA